MWLNIQSVILLSFRWLSQFFLNLKAKLAAVPIFYPFDSCFSAEYTGFSVVISKSEDSRHTVGGQRRRLSRSFYYQRQYSL